MRQTIGILTNNQVTFFQSQQTLCLNSERADAIGLAGFHQCIPQRCSVLGGYVNLIAPLADETHPHDACRDTGDHALSHGEVREGR